MNIPPKTIVIELVNEMPHRVQRGARCEDVDIIVIDHGSELLAIAKAGAGQRSNGLEGASSFCERRESCPNS